MDNSELLALKEKIDSYTEEKARLSGRLSHIIDELKKEHKCNSIEEAEQKVQEIDKDIKKLQKQFNKKLSKLKSEIDKIEESDE